MRLDRFLCEMNVGSRSQVKALLRQGLVTVNGKAEKEGAIQIREYSDDILFRGNKLQYQRFVYYMLNKPEGVVSATEDKTAVTVVSLLSGEGRDDLFPVGRLDKDTTGLLLLTNDGETAHRLLSPKRHVDKIYRVTLEHPLERQAAAILEQGVDIGDDKLTLPAQVSVQDDCTLLLTIQEGRYHQVKRMLQAVGNRVLALERISFGGLALDEKLKPGEYRTLTSEEIALLGIRT